MNSACRKVEEWYVGDGWYADGPSFAFDYYSSYVFHPMYLETLQAMVDAKVNSRLDYQKYYDRELKRCQKYSIISRDSFRQRVLSRLSVEAFLTAWQPCSRLP